MKLNNDANKSYKIGVDEVEGLKDAMFNLMQPIRSAIKAKTYWTDVKLHEAEYKSRDGFIPHSHNCGGVQIHEVIPKCEEYEFCFLEFGECDYDDCNHEVECLTESDGLLDASLQVFFKFEGLDENGVGSFYIILNGGNNDAPYFRQSNDIYEYDFEASSLDELKRKFQKPMADIIRIINK